MAPPLDLTQPRSARAQAQSRVCRDRRKHTGLRARRELFHCFFFVCNVFLQNQLNWISELKKDTQYSLKVEGNNPP